jgi:hypothetical protein
LYRLAFAGGRARRCLPVRGASIAAFPKETRTMTTLHDTAVPVFDAMLLNLATLLDKAAAHAAAKGYDVAVLLQSRLAPDMFTLTRQVQLTCDFAKNSAYRLAAIDPPKMPDEEQSLADLRGRVTRTIALLEALTPDTLAGAEHRHITVPLRTRTLELDGLPFIQRWTLPNFYFHLTTVYALLRQAGVELGKQDFLGGV